MKKILIVFVIALVLLGICYLAFFGGSKVLDFRGEVTDIYGEGGEIVLTLDGGIEIKVDSRTKVKPCCDTDPEITMNDIKIGDVVDGDYRAAQKGTAKYITVWYK